MRVGDGLGRGVEGIAVAVRVGVADSKDEGATEGTNVAEGGAGEAESGRVAMGVAVLPHPAMNTPTTITSRKREAIIRFMCHLLSSVSAQRLALAAVGGRVDSPSKRKKLKATKMPKKRAAYPPSAARCVGRF
jgi:hypothetical protein